MLTPCNGIGIFQVLFFKSLILKNITKETQQSCEAEKCSLPPSPAPRNNRMSDGGTAGPGCSRAQPPRKAP